MKTNNTKPKTQVKATIEESMLTRMPLIAGAAFAIITWALLNIFEHEFLYRVQELSLWLPTKVYFDERMMVPGGLMTYIACFLTLAIHFWTERVHSGYTEAALQELYRLMCRWKICKALLPNWKRCLE